MRTFPHLAEVDLWLWRVRTAFQAILNQLTTAMLKTTKLDRALRGAVFISCDKAHICINYYMHYKKLLTQGRDSLPLSISFTLLSSPVKHEGTAETIICTSEANPYPRGGVDSTTSENNKKVYRPRMLNVVETSIKIKLVRFGSGIAATHFDTLSCTSLEIHFAGSPIWLLERVSLIGGASKFSKCCCRHLVNA